MRKILFILFCIAIALSVNAQGIYNDGAYIVSETGTSWVVSGGNFTLTSTNAVNPATMYNLKIESGASLTLPSTTCLTVNGALANVAGTAGLMIKSDASSTGSLKVLGSVSGRATVLQWMAPNAWHLISSPVATEPVIDFLNDNMDVAIDLATKNSPPYTFAMRDYNVAGTGWTSYFTGAKPNTHLFGTGKGYLVLTREPVVVSLEFKGDLNTLPVSNVAVKTGWNLVGNPFTSAISINSAAGTASGGTNFIGENTSTLTGSYAAIYVWDETATPKEYQVVNHTYNGSAAFYAQVGQGFFVKSAVDGNLNFGSSMQVHQGAAPFKGATTPTPQIKLIAGSTIGSMATVIKFIEGTTAGLDVGYDAGVFKSEPTFSVYTKLVADNGVEFQLQCLPPTGYDKMVIPIGIDSKSAGEIVFTVQTVQLEQNCKVILEDKLTNTFTDLSTNSYKAALAANTAGSGRFYLHTGDIVSGVEDQMLPGKVTAYAKGNKEIRIIGEVGDGAVATLVNGLGQVVLTKLLGAGKLNIIGPPNLSSGIYLLNINDKGTPQTIKIMIRK